MAAQDEHNTVIRDRQRVYSMIDAERRRQDTQWGGPRHDDLLHDSTWLAVLTKQVGRLGGAVLLHFQPGRPSPLVVKQRHRSIRNYLVRVAAVSVAWIEALDRRDKGIKCL